MDAEIPVKLQKVEIRAFDDQRNRDSWNSLSKYDTKKDSRHTTV